MSDFEINFFDVNEPVLHPLPRGGFLATTHRANPMRIGVIGIDEEDAKAKFRQSLKRWREILAQDET